MSSKKSAKKPEVKPRIPTVQVLPAEKATPATPYATALARADAVVHAAGNVCQGFIPTQRASHGSAWQDLLTEDQATREQILHLKAKENEVLGMIRDRVASNLMETIDAAVEQGVLEAPEEV